MLRRCVNLLVSNEARKQITFLHNDDSGETNLQLSRYQITVYSWTVEFKHINNTSTHSHSHLLQTDACIFTPLVVIEQLKLLLPLKELGIQDPSFLSFPLGPPKHLGDLAFFLSFPFACLVIGAVGVVGLHCLFLCFFLVVCCLLVWLGTVLFLFVVCALWSQ